MRKFDNGRSIDLSYKYCTILAHRNCMNFLHVAMMKYPRLCILYKTEGSRFCRCKVSHLVVAFLLAPGIYGERQGTFHLLIKPQDCIIGASPWSCPEILITFQMPAEADSSRRADAGRHTVVEGALQTLLHLAVQTTRQSC